MYRVYLITNLVNNKQYVGFTSKSVEVRFNWHCTRKNCTALYSAIKKHGDENFSIQELFVTEDLDVALSAENHLIDAYKTLKNGYNLTEGGRYAKMSDSARIKMSQSKLGIKRGPMSLEQRRKLSNTRIEKKLKPSKESILKGIKTRKINNKGLPSDFGFKISERQRGADNPAARSIVCNETGLTFKCVLDAANFYGLNKNCISHVLNGRNKTAGKDKLTFSYLNKEKLCSYKNYHN